MSKDTYYFQHDYEPTSDPKMSAMIGVYGAVGYGLFWRIIEMLHSDETHKLPHKQYIFISLSKQMLTGIEQCSTMFPPVETVQRFVDDCIKLFELFISDGKFFYSERVNRNISKRENEKINKSNAGKASAEKRRFNNLTPVEQKSTPVEQNPTKESKGKEIKEKENINDALCIYDAKTLYTEFTNSNDWMNWILSSVIAKEKRIDHPQLIKFIQMFIEEQRIQDTINKSFGEFKRHFFNWFKIQMQKHVPAKKLNYVN